MIGGRLSSVLADVLVLIATWTRTWPMRVEASKINFTARFAAILMRDARRIDLIEPMSTWIALVTAIFTSRFILDLHEAADTLSREGTTQLTDFGTLETIAFHIDSRPPRARYGPNTSRSVYGAVLTDLSVTSDWDDPVESLGSRARATEVPRDKSSCEIEMVGVAV
ncbi:hypothetical protein FKP32DRAFT_219974 [Trametes sanguinea]|nr:hypothetical protein FKP32DRAFT_219974 [Trametes sanguinea]